MNIKWMNNITQLLTVAKNAKFMDNSNQNQPNSQEYQIHILKIFRFCLLDRYFPHKYIFARKIMSWDLDPDPYQNETDPTNKYSLCCTCGRWKPGSVSPL